jgi:hypothetical protein
MEKMNREQRRREKYGHAGGATKEPWPQSEANPVFGHGDEAATDPVVPDQEAALKTVPAKSGAAKRTSKSGDSARASKSDDSAKG